MVKSINRTDIVKQIAKDLGLTIKQTCAIAEEAEEAIIEFVRVRGQARLHGFGSFYKTTIKSHVIKQIRTKTPRIILEQTAVKFRTAPSFKDQIYSREKIKIKESATKIIDKPREADNGRWKQLKGNIPVKYQPTPPKPEPKRITLKPFALHPRAKKEEIQKKIKERWLSVARSHRDETPKTQIIREAEIFIKLLWQLKKSGHSSIDFSLDSSLKVKIFSGRPRSQISHLPREVVKGFLSFLDLEDFHIPQERFRPIYNLEKKYDRINVELHSLPTDKGASIHLVIK